jgi:hypothetical protein
MRWQLVSAGQVSRPSPGQGPSNPSCDRAQKQVLRQHTVFVISFIIERFVCGKHGYLFLTLWKK